MTVVLILLGVLLLLLLLLLTCPLALRLEGAREVKLTLFVLGIPLDFQKLISRRKKEPKQKAPSPEKESMRKSKTSLLRTASDFLSFLRAIFRAVKVGADELGRHLKIRVHHLTVTVATDNAARTALLYGEIHALFDTLFSFCEEACDFRADYDKTVVRADFEAAAFSADFRVTVFYPPIFLLTGYARVMQAYSSELLLAASPAPTARQTTTKRKDQ